MLLFQLIPIIGFVAPPLSKSHMVLACDLVTFSNFKYVKLQAYTKSIWAVWGKYS